MQVIYGPIKDVTIPDIKDITMPEYDKVQAGDTIEQTHTGAVRSSSEGKGRPELIPYHGIMRLARHYENGAKKYDSDNWAKGISIRRCVGSAIRHLYKYLWGDRSEDHLAAAAWNVFTIMDHEERIERGLLDKSLDDLPKFKMFKDDEFTGC